MSLYDANGRPVPGRLLKVTLVFRMPDDMRDDEIGAFLGAHVHVSLFGAQLLQGRGADVIRPPPVARIP